MSSLGNREKQLLLEVARRALIAAVERRESLEIPPQELSLTETAGAFVTLRCRGRLRACIGQIKSSQLLFEVVAYSAKAAALEDSRFNPVRSEELAEIDIELSVLSLLEEIAPDRIEAGRHGLIVTRGSQRGVLLPQVATERRWNAERFLEESCVKAGLQREAWKTPGTLLQGFSAEVFSESEFRSDVRLDAKVRPTWCYSVST
jgi:AmmeMemoRadiSam system protein A